MKRIFIVLAVVVASSAVAEDQRSVKRALIHELLNVIDAKSLTRSILDVMVSPAEMTKSMSEDERRAFAGAIQRDRDELYAKIDYAKYAEEVYAPILDQTCDVADLKQLIAFYKNPAGPKGARVIAELVAGTLVHGGRLMTGASEAVRQETENKDLAAHPGKAAMADLRALATATEAYATEVNKYPNVKSVAELRPLLGAYIKKMPEKDPWGTPYLYVVAKDGLHYRFVSAGADKRFDASATTIAMPPQSVPGKASDSLDDDIIYEDGRFLQYPAVSARVK